MANIVSQKKRIARSAREHEENRRLRSAVKTYTRRLERAAGGDPSAVDVEHRALVSRIDKAVRKGAMHANKGARRKAQAERIRAEAR